MPVEKARRKKLAGIFPIVPTPFRDDGLIDEEDFIACIEFAINCGAHGLVFPGIGSEVERLTNPERSRLVEVAAQTIDKRVPFVAGASGVSEIDVINFVLEAEESGADFVMVMAPGRCGIDVNSQVDFYSTVASKTKLGIVLQNWPPPMGAGLSPEALIEVARAVPRVSYVKEEMQPSGPCITAIVAQGSDHLEGVFGGMSGRFLIDEFRRGAVGSMPAADLTDLFVSAHDAWASGKEDLARKAFSRLLPLINAQSIYRWRMTKRILARRGVIRHTTVRMEGPELDVEAWMDVEAMLGDVAPHLHPNYPTTFDDVNAFD